MKLKAVPAAVLTGAVTLKCVPADAVTLVGLDALVIEPLTVSVAMMVCEPAVFNVALNVPKPFVNVAFAGNTAWPSLLVKCTVPV